MHLCLKHCWVFTQRYNCWIIPFVMLLTFGNSASFPSCICSLPPTVNVRFPVFLHCLQWYSCIFFKKLAPFGGYIYLIVILMFLSLMINFFLHLLALWIFSWAIFVHILCPFKKFCLFVNIIKILK